MTDVDRRIALAALLGLVSMSLGMAQAAQSDMAMPGSSIHWMGDKQIGMLIYPGMTILDLIGPQSMLGSMMDAKIHLVAKSMDPVTSDAG